ncbi:hypothetical protein NA57DRAFT_78837 [Rhizodiscina lignyota]|uniref:CCHC-type domain-containing protein n=1 Tax=Rhizodiscina lignyota TaxID=1504668 RepID=A0A9P4I6V2_9PEZI|nr:hypothetical protein NA57DRAFT_78837 [Rhizodiscina lignyota]
MPTPTGPEKTMSSRLLTMKFMQRGAASAPSTPPSNGPPSKRVRLSNGTASPATPSFTQKAVEAALAAEEEQRIRALEKHAALSGETRWVLAVQEPPRVDGGLNVVTAGFGDIDKLDDDSGEAELRMDENAKEEGLARPTTGRRTFGKVKRPVEENKDADSDASSSSSSDSEGEDEGDPNDLATQLIRESRKLAHAERKKKRRAEKAAQAQAQMAEKRRRKEVKLNNLTSISGGGTPRSDANMTCFLCGETGHRKSECPRLQGQGQGPKCYYCGEIGHMKNECPRRRG